MFVLLAKLYPLSIDFTDGIEVYTITCLLYGIVQRSLWGEGWRVGLPLPLPFKSHFPPHCLISTCCNLLVCMLAIWYCSKITLGGGG